MRSVMILGLLGGAAAALVPIGDQPAARPGSDTALCRRAAPLPPLQPEPKAPSGQRDRWESRDKLDDSPVVVTGIRSSLAEAAPTPPAAPPPAPSVGAVDIGTLPDRSVSEAVTRVPGVALNRFAGASAAPPISPEPPAGGFVAGRVARIQAGLLTAGDHDDLLNPELYAHYVANFLKTETLKGVPRVDTGSVLTVEVRDAGGRPVPFAEVTLTCADGNSLTLATVADGTAVFFPVLDRLGNKVRLSVGGAERNVSIAGAPGQQRQSVTLGQAAGAVRRFDLAVVIDTTGSMSDELEFLKVELRSIMADLDRSHPGLDIRLALIPYRDKGDEYVTRTFPFTTNLDGTQAALAAQSANGGGDYPEAMEQAMARAVSLDWRADAVKSLLLVADAPPHAEDVASTWGATEVARARRIQIVPVAASGVGEGAEYLMRAMAAATQSRYLFLTDDSGIGNPHAPPAIDCYLVTRLNALIRRTLDSQIAGRRVEPKDDEVIRAVGTYDKGRCVLPSDFGKQD